MQNQHQIADSIKAHARELGLLDCVILPVEPLSEEEDRLKIWLENKMHGAMHYMSRNIEKRIDPSLLFENAKTIIVVLQNYYPEDTQFDKVAPVISKYAYGTDYHFVLKNKLKSLLLFINEKIQDCKGRAFVDSAPVLERAWARRAGLGWIGKNSNLISVEHGSFFFIGELLLDVELPYDTPKIVNDYCGKCTRCIEACPTKAIVANKVIDARKCISYQTIELKGELDQNLKGKFENRVFGCDICQDVCPWNMKSVKNNEPGFKPDKRLLDYTKDDWYRMDKSLFDDLFKKSAVKRTGFEGLNKNLQFIEKG